MKKLMSHPSPLDDSSLINIFAFVFECLSLIEVSHWHDGNPKFNILLSRSKRSAPSHRHKAFLRYPQWPVEPQVQLKKKSTVSFIGRYFHIPSQFRGWHVRWLFGAPARRARRATKSSKWISRARLIHHLAAYQFTEATKPPSHQDTQL